MKGLHQFTRQTRKAHRYLMAIVGIQLFIWAASGTYMVWLNIHSIHGDEWLQSPPVLTGLGPQSYPISELAIAFPKATNIKLKMLGDKPVYLFKQFAQTIMLDATNGEKISPLSSSEIQELLPFVIDKPQSFFDNNIKNINLLTDSVPEEISGRSLPLWQIELKDWDSTTIYIGQNNGEVEYVRHNRWRIFDLFWRLHIMDYSEGEDIGNNLLIFATVLSFIAVLAGFVLLTLRLRLYTVTSRLTSKIIRPNQSISYTSRIQNFIKKTHKWFALIVLIQLLIWMVSGFLLGQVDYDLASGKATATWVHEKPKTFLNTEKLSHTSLLNLLDISELVQVVSLRERDNQWLYQLQYKKGRHSYWPAYFELFNTSTGDAEPLNEQMLVELAWQSIDRDYKVSMAQEVTQQSLDPVLLVPPIDDLPNEYNRVWQVKLADHHNTAIYFNADNGDLIAHVNDTTRWRNLLLMLHFMDYLPHNPKQGAFNNVFIKTMSIFALALSLSGLAWLLSLLWLYLRQDRGSTLLLDSLIASKQLTTANCGGGGTCGRCTFLSSTPPEPNDREKALLSQIELDQGVRLACQHKVNGVSGVSVYVK
ncbi:2Fe-2S iron-sulfur cluster-binding protein [Glaciecola petra]|uniref:PepSY domain-containing protein n=1 Tax=Glaciecola petra TaxID=3075602 RepID=A0ABU2ZUI0_9ALTE|nr:PepSY domain-containing protein [Aestuariibacter sp. P117]MDT0596297.1 PepSY domain-containing protein [Aestuariibacter sp. P117]